MTQRDLSDELVEAIELGIDADEYCAARGAGVSHQECLEVIQHPYTLEEEPYALAIFICYREARQLGATHAECMEVLDRRVENFGSSGTNVGDRVGMTWEFSLQGNGFGVGG